jgi:hypothetical protein
LALNLQANRNQQVAYLLTQGGNTPAGLVFCKQAGRVFGEFYLAGRQKGG